jgi:hypothetical protein
VQNAFLYAQKAQKTGILRNFTNEKTKLSTVLRPEKLKNLRVHSRQKLNFCNIFRKIKFFFPVVKGKRNEIFAKTIEIFIFLP